MLSNQTISAIQDAIRKAVDHVPHDDDFEVMTDLHLQINADTCTLTIADDNNTVIAQATVGELADIDLDTQLSQLVTPITTLLHHMADQGQFANTHIAKPFAFVLEDKDSETIDDLYVVDDDDTIYIPGTLLQGIDQELDDFLEHLMTD
ncbi:MAG: hypothetical protein IJ139_10240 [Bacteroidaceae bacterium]|nr:hypothetical protein [Bacteroidaceae bacterium]MBQ9177227.1 hypothetical protein [Bacteroidaceae bacterium]MBR1377702.1 hypothetical protein [Bacteroidaceae bacterium]